MHLFGASKPKSMITNAERVLRVAYRFYETWPNKKLTHGVFLARCRTLDAQTFRESVGELVRERLLTWSRPTHNGTITYELTAEGREKGRELDTHFVR